MTCTYPTIVPDGTTQPDIAPCGQAAILEFSVYRAGPPPAYISVGRACPPHAKGEHARTRAIYRGATLRLDEVRAPVLR